MKVRLLVKVAVLVAMIFTYNAIMNFVSPIVANELAMAQMNNMVDSNLRMQLYTYALKHEKVALAIFIVALLGGEVREIIKRLKEKKREKED